MNKLNKKKIIYQINFIKKIKNILFVFSFICRSISNQNEQKRNISAGMLSVSLLIVFKMVVVKNNKIRFSSDPRSLAPVIRNLSPLQLLKKIEIK